MPKKGQYWISCLAVCGLGALACDTLYGLDTPRPALGKDDTFVIDPSCADLPVDASALAALPTIITITGRRGGSGLGAESVPVSVRVGACGSDEAAGDGGAASGGAGGASVVDNVVGPACVEARQPLSALDAAQFELTALEARGCRQRSPSRLDCTLDPSGEAAFGVVGHLADDFNLTGYLPICVTPLSPDAPRERLLAVVPRVGASRAALAVVQLDEQEAAPIIASGASCAELLSCDAARPRARLQVGVVSRDLPVDSIRREDFRPVTRDVTLAAQVAVTKAPAGGVTPFLSTDAACPAPQAMAQGSGGAPDDAAPGLALHIESAHGASEVFYLCAPSYAASAEVTATLVDGEAQAPVLVPHTVALTALTNAFSARPDGESFTLFSQACGEATHAVAPSAIPTHPPAISSDGQRILLACGATAPGAGGATDNGGAASSGASSGGAPSEVAASSCSLELEVGPEGTCTLKVGN